MIAPAHLEPKALLAMSLHYANRRFPHQREVAEDAAGHAVLDMLQAVRKRPAAFESLPYTRAAIMLLVVEFGRKWSKYSRTERRPMAVHASLDAVASVDDSGDPVLVLDQIADPSSTLFAQLIADEDAAVDLLQALRDTCPNAVPFVLRIIEGESAADVARSEGVNPNAMHARMSHMRHRMAEFDPARRAA